MKFYKLDEAAGILSVHRITLYKWREKGKIRFTRVCGNPRISEEEIKRISKPENYHGKANCAN